MICLKRTAKSIVQLALLIVKLRLIEFAVDFIKILLSLIVIFLGEMIVFGVIGGAPFEKIVVEPLFVGEKILVGGEFVEQFVDMVIVFG